MNKELYEKAKSKVHSPLPHVISLYGWRLSTNQCFAKAGGVARQDWGGHQCNRKPKYHVGQLQFCTFHAKEISPDLVGMEKVTEPLFKSKMIKVNPKAFDK